MRLFFAKKIYPDPSPFCQNTVDLSLHRSPKNCLLFLKIELFHLFEWRKFSRWSNDLFIPNCLILPTDTYEERFGEEQKPGQARDRSIRHLLPGSSDCDLHRQGVQILLSVLLPHLERGLLEHLSVERLSESRMQETTRGGIVGSFDRPVSATYCLSFRSLLSSTIRIDCVQVATINTKENKYSFLKNNR